MQLLIFYDISHSFNFDEISEKLSIKLQCNSSFKEKKWKGWSNWKGEDSKDKPEVTGSVWNNHSWWYKAKWGGGGGVDF